MLEAQGAAGGSAQGLCTSEGGVPPPAPGPRASEHVCAVTARECRGVATAGLPSPPSQAGQGGLLLLGLAGVVALLLVEASSKWERHLDRGGGDSWATCTVCEEATCGTASASCPPAGGQLRAHVAPVPGVRWPVGSSWPPCTALVACSCASSTSRSISSRVRRNSSPVHVSSGILRSNTSPLHGGSGISSRSSI